MHRIANRVLIVLIGALGVSVAIAEGISDWQFSLQEVSGAMRVTTKQESVSADKSVLAQLQASEAGAAAQLDQYNYEQVRKVYNDFGPNGQMVDPCYQMSMASSTTTTKAKADSSAQNAASLVYSVSDTGQVNPGGLSGLLGVNKSQVGLTYAASSFDRVNRHLTRYCSVAESAQGYCSLNANGMQAGDSDFSLHLQPGKTYGWDEVEAATDFTKTIAPMRPTTTDLACSSAECLAARMEARRQEASISMARFSMMRFVEAHSTQMTGDAKTPSSVAAPL